MDKRHAIIQADARAQGWLARLNDLEERGKVDTKAYKEAKRKVQYWLDRLNSLEGYND